MHRLTLIAILALLCALPSHAIAKTEASLATDPPETRLISHYEWLSTHNELTQSKVLPLSLPLDSEDLITTNELQLTDDYSQIIASAIQNRVEMDLPSYEPKPKRLCLAKVVVTLDATGNLKATAIYASSRQPAFDHFALRSVNRSYLSQHFPPPPEKLLAMGTLSYLIPVSAP